jgi:hypothetical protein
MKKSLTFVFLVLTLVSLFSCSRVTLGNQSQVVVTNTVDEVKDTVLYTKYLVTYNYTNINGDTITQVLVMPKKWLVTDMISADEIPTIVRIDTLETNIMESDL